MDDRTAQRIKAMAAMRMAIGAAALVAPGRAVRSWLGDDADRPGVKALTRMAAGRDLAVGVGTWLALSHDGPVRGWLEAGTLSDSADVLASLLAFRRLRRPAGVVVVVASAGAVAAGRALVRAQASES